jgi:HTH-type transcriptional regulator/antitoxin MqsA
MKRFENESMQVEHAGRSVKVTGLSGWRCSNDGEVIFDASSARRYAKAGDKLVEEERQHEAAEIRRIRQKLKLSQKRASLLTGGGHNAFSRYERGIVTPIPAIKNLLRLLDEDPKLLRKLGVMPDLKGEPSVVTRRTTSSKVSA